MSVVTASTSKGEKSKKFQSLDINNIYQGSASKPQQKAIPQKHGLQSLGKVPTARRAPANLPSLKAENSGNGPTVNLVPAGSSGWGKDDAIATNSTGSSSNSKGVLGNGGPPLSSQQQPGPKQPTQHDHLHHHPSQTSSTSSDLNTTSKPPTWNNVTQGPVKRQDFHGQRSNPLFGQEFPSLSGSVANGQDDFAGGTNALSGSPSAGSIAQKLKGELGHDLKYGPGPNLRPQTFGNWSHGGSSKPQNDVSSDVSSNQTPSVGTGSHGKHSESQQQNRGLSTSAGFIHQAAPPHIHQRDLVSAASQAFKFDVSTKPGYSSGPVVSGLSSSLLRKSASTTNADLAKQRHNGQRGPRKENPFSASFQKQSIIDDEKLKRMDELENEDSDWTKCDVKFDYNKTIASDDEEDLKSNWTDHIKQPEISKLASDLYEGGNQSRRIVPPSSDYLDEEEQRRAKSEEVLKTIERAKRRREEEEQKYKGQYSQNSYRNEYEYHGGSGQGRFHQEHPRDRRQPSGGDRNRRSPGGFRPRDNHDHRQQPLSPHGASQTSGFGKFDVESMGSAASGPKPIDQSDQRTLQDEQRSIAQKEERNQQHYNDGGRFSGRKPIPQSSIPPRFKRNGGELHPIKRTSPPKDSSPDISGNVDSPKEEFGWSHSRGSSSRKSPGSWDRQSSSGGSDIRERHSSADKLGGSVTDVLSHKEDESSPASIMDSVKSQYSSYVARDNEGSNEFFDRGDSKDFFSVDGGQHFGAGMPTDSHASIGTENDWNHIESDSQTNHLTQNDPSGHSRRDFDGGRYHDDRYGKQGGKLGKHSDQGFSTRGMDRGDRRGRGGRRGDPNSMRSSGNETRFDRSQGRPGGSGSNQLSQTRKIILPDKGRHQQDSVHRKQDELQNDGMKGGSEDHLVAGVKDNMTEAMKTLSMGSTGATPPPPLEHLVPNKAADLQALQQLQQQQQQPGQGQFPEPVQQKPDCSQEQNTVPVMTDSSQLSNLPKAHGEQGFEEASQTSNAGWFAPRGQPSRRGRGGLNMGMPRPGAVSDTSNPAGLHNDGSNSYSHQRVKREEEWEALSDRSYDDKKTDNFGDSGYSRSGSSRNQRYSDTGYGRRGGGGDRRYDAKEKRGGGGSAMDRGGSKGMGFENRRQNKLPPRLAKQKEQSRMTAPGANQTGWESSGPVDSVANSFSAWGDQEQNVLQQRHHAMGDFGSFRDGEGVDTSNGNIGPGGDGVGQTRPMTDNSTPSESQNAPVQTIIFENTNFKGGRGPVQGIANAAGMTGNMAAALGADKLGFKNVGELKQDGLQMPLGFVGVKGGEDAGGLSLDFNFVDTDASMHHQSQHHDQKMQSLSGVSKTNAAAMPHHNSHPTEDLNMKIASVKKVWEPMPSMSPVPDSSSAFTQGFTSTTNASNTDAKAFASGANSNPASGAAGGNGGANDMESAEKASPTNGGFGASEKAVETVGTSNVAKVRPQQQQSQMQAQPSQQNTGIPPHHVGAQAQQQHSFQQLQDERAASFRAAAAMMNAGHTGAAGNGGNGNYNRLPNLGSGTLPAALQSPQSILNQPPNLYPTFQLDHSRGVTTNQLYPAYPAGLGGQASVLLPSSGLSAAGSGADIFGPNAGTQFRLQGASGAAQFGQQQSSGNTVLLSQSGLMSSQVKQSNQIGPIGTKGGNGPFQQSGLGTLPASGTSPLHLIPFDSQGNAPINYAMPNAAMQRSQQQAAGQTAFYQALAASTQQAAAASRQQSGFHQGFAAHQLNAQLRNAVAASVTIAPPPPVGMPYLKPDASTVQVQNSLKGGVMASVSGRNDSFGGVQYGNPQQQKAYASASQSATGNSTNNGPASVSSSGPTYSPTPIQRPMGVQGKSMPNEDDSVSDIKDSKKKSSEE